MCVALLHTGVVPPHINDPHYGEGGHYGDEDHYYNTGVVPPHLADAPDAPDAEARPEYVDPGFGAEDADLPPELIFVDPAYEDGETPMGEGVVVDEPVDEVGALLEVTDENVIADIAGSAWAT